jgi:hypothetical protein
VQSPPDGLSESAIADTLRDGWDVVVASMEYRPVGFGSHHWEVLGADERRWFVTVDDLDLRRQSEEDTREAVFEWLVSALTTTREVREAGGSFAVAPVRARSGEVGVRIPERFALAVYPHVEGRSFTWSEFSEHGQRRSMLDLIIALHGIPTAVTTRAITDDFDIPGRDLVDKAIAGGGIRGDEGPYAKATLDLMSTNAESMRRRLEHYDRLVDRLRRTRGDDVISHGEPHPGNTMLTPDGWVLVDWDTVMLAPPERDLWSLDLGDGAILGAYTEATGRTPDPSMLELYRIGWDLKDIAAYVTRFALPHSGDLDDDKSWRGLHSMVAG